MGNLNINVPITCKGEKRGGFYMHITSFKVQGKTKNVGAKKKERVCPHTCWEPKKIRYCYLIEPEDDHLVEILCITIKLSFLTPSKCAGVSFFLCYNM